MKLIFTLGNHEPRYSGTRHNVGFMVADHLASEHDASWTEKAKFKATVAEYAEQGEKIIVAMPSTYYNLVGQSYRAVVDFYKLAPEDVLVIHDDLALPFGTIRTRIGGSGGGNNGIKSINAHGGDTTHRLRIGIANDLRDTVDDADFVLGKFSRAEATALKDMQPKVDELVAQFIAGELPATTHQAV